jgi:hypothetical protein
MNFGRDTISLLLLAALSLGPMGLAADEDDKEDNFGVFVGSASSVNGAELRNHHHWGEKKDWRWDLSLGKEHSDADGDPNDSILAYSGLAHSFQPAFGFDAGFHYRRAEQRDIQTYGPSLNLDFSLPRRGGSIDSVEGEKAPLASLKIGAAMKFYDMTDGLDDNQRLSLSQIEPDAKLELPLLRGRLKPSISGSADAYSGDPAPLSNFLQDRNPPSALESKGGDLSPDFPMAGFEIGLGTVPAEGWDTDFTYGMHYLVSGRASVEASLNVGWEQDSGLRLEGELGWSRGVSNPNFPQDGTGEELDYDFKYVQPLLETFKLELGWSHSVEGANTSDELHGGLTWNFGEDGKKTED